MKKLLAILTATAMLLSLCACGGGNEENPDAENTNSIAAEENEEVKDAEENEEVKDAEEKEYTAKKAQKIGSLTSENYISGSGGAFTYSQDGLRGYISFDGTKDTGAVYYNYDWVGDYIAVKTKQNSSPDDFDALNSTILIDGFGNTLISEGFCMFKTISGTDKYVCCAKVIEKVDSKNEADVFISDSSFSLTPDDDDLLYKAEYYIYDATTGRKIEGVVADDNYISAYGDILIYEKDGKRTAINSKGEPLPEKAKLIEYLDGYYVVGEKNTEVVYNAFGEKICVFELNGYCPESRANGRILCCNEKEKKVAVFDDSGKMISSEIPYTSDYCYARLEGDYIVIDDDAALECIYDIKGNLVKTMNGYFHYNKDGENEYYIVTTFDSDMVILDTEGNILFEVEENNDYQGYSYPAYKKVDDEYYYFCIKDKDFTIKASRAIDETNYVINDYENSSWEIIDTVSGEIVLEGDGDCDYATNGSDVYICVYVGNDYYEFYKL